MKFRYIQKDLEGIQTKFRQNLDKNLDKIQTKFR